MKGSDRNLCAVGCRCGGSGRETQSHHRFPDSHHTGAAGSRRESGAGHRGVPPRHSHPRGLRHPAQKPQLRRLGPPRACTIFKAAGVVHHPAEHFCLFSYLFCKRLRYD